METKRINMDVDAGLWKIVKKAAIDQDIELREWVTQAIKEKLNASNVRKKKEISARVPQEEQG